MKFTSSNNNNYYLFAYILIISFITSSCAQSGQKHELKEFKYGPTSVNHPISWKLNKEESTDQASHIYSPVEGFNDKFKEGLHIYKQNLCGESLDLIAFDNASMETLNNKNPIFFESYIKLENGDSFFIKILSLSEGDNRFMVYSKSCIKYHKAYIINFICEENQAQKYRPLADQILSSFRVNLSYTHQLSESDIWINQTSVKEAIQHENSLESKQINLSYKSILSEDLYPLRNRHPLDQPVIFQRKQSGFLPITTEYYFSKGDSILRVLNYSWELGLFGNYNDKQKIWDEECGKVNEYTKEYELILSNLLKKIGVPKHQDKELIKKINSIYVNAEESESRTTEWDTETFHSTLYMVISSNTYRIKWRYYWK